MLWAVIVFAHGVPKLFFMVWFGARLSLLQCPWHFRTQYPEPSILKPKPLIYWNVPAHILTPRLVTRSAMEAQGNPNLSTLKSLSQRLETARREMKDFVEPLALLSRNPPLYNIQ